MLSKHLHTAFHPQFYYPYSLIEQNQVRLSSVLFIFFCLTVMHFINHLIIFKAAGGVLDSGGKNLVNFGVNRNGKEKRNVCSSCT